MKETPSTPEFENQDVEKKLEEHHIEQSIVNSAIDPWDRDPPPRINRHNYQDFNYFDDYNDDRR